MKSLPEPRSGPAGARLLLTLGACLAALLSLAVPGRGGTLDAAKIKETVFPNGLRLIVRDTHAAELAAVQVWVRAGGFTEDENTSGTAHVIEGRVFTAPSFAAGTAYARNVRGDVVAVDLRGR